MSGSLPSTTDVETLLATIDALIGLGAAFPQTRSRIESSTRDESRYEQLWHEADEGFANLQRAGFPIINPNLHQSLKSIWAWCITFQEAWGDMRRKPRELYAETIDRLRALKDIFVTC